MATSVHSQQQQQNSALSSSQAFLSQNKYGGLIQQPLHKKIRNSLFQLNTYLTETCPNMIFMHEVISIFRILQLFGPALLINFSFWKEDSISQRVLEIFSIFFHLIPPSYREEATTAASFIYVGFIILFYALLISSAFYLMKSAKLNKGIALSCFIVINTASLQLIPTTVIATSQPEEWILL